MATFFSTGTQNGGQETTALTAVTQITHHGGIYVPFGYQFGKLQFNNSIAHGGSPYGAGTLAGPDGSASPLEDELEMAKAQGAYFAKTAKALKVGRAASA
jgi:NAD(P)H dehydrogenase (quinone)